MAVNLVKSLFMKAFMVILLLLACTMWCLAESPAGKNPLAKYSEEWNDPKYLACNTAANTTYLSETEKEIVYVLNMARMNPQLFCRTVVSQAHTISQYIDTSNVVYYKSLVLEMDTMQPLGLLKPDQKCYISAQCHAISTGEKGAVTHNRLTKECRKKQYFRGECCQYGLDYAVDIILNLLVDQDVESLGHRSICLGNYTKMSPSMEKHKKYGIVTVMDFDKDGFFPR